MKQKGSLRTLFLYLLVNKKLLVFTIHFRIFKQFNKVVNKPYD